MKGAIASLKVSNFSGDMSPSSLTTSERSDLATNVAANTSGESDPGYESDGTKKLLRLQIRQWNKNCVCFIFMFVIGTG